MSIDDQKSILRLELLTGHQLLFDKDQQRCYIEFKLDGESKQSQYSTKPDCYFGQVFHFNLGQNKNAQRELQIMLCNLNRGGYMSKQTLGKQNLRDLEFTLNKPFDCKFTNKIKDKTVTIQVILSFISNLFVDNVQGEIQVDLQSLYPQSKGILAMSLGGNQTVYTSSSGTCAKIINNSPYCKLTLLYYENLALKDYLGVNQIKLLKQIPIKKEIYLCDLNWGKYDNKLKILVDQIKLGTTGIIKLLFTLTPDQQVQQIQQIEQKVAPTKRVIHIKSIKIDGFPFKELSNAKFYLQIRTPTLFYFTSISVVPQWDCDIVIYEQNYTLILYNYCGDADKKNQMLAMFENESEGKLSLSYQQYLKAFYSSNPNTYSKIVSCLNLIITCDKEYYSSSIIDNPRGIVQVPLSEYTINEYSGGSTMFETKSIFDFVQIRKFKANKIETAFDIPIFTLNEKIQFGGQEIPISYEADQSTLQPVMEEKYEKSNFVKITVWQAKMAKHDQLQLSITTDEIEFKTSKIFGTFFGQSFICKFPNKLSFSLTNFSDSDVISDIYSTLIDLAQLDITTFEQFINVQLSSSTRQCLLTLKLEMSGTIHHTSKLIITPQSLYPLSTEGSYYVRVYQAYRFIYDLQQTKNDREYLVFDSFEWLVDDIWKPIRFQLFYQTGNKSDGHTLLADNQFQALDLLWRNKHYVIRDKCRFSVAREIIHTVQQPQLKKKPLESPKIFVKFTLLGIIFKQDELQKEIVKGCAIQLHHIQNDSIARLQDTKNFEFNNSMIELDRTELNITKYPIATQLLNQSMNISLIKQVNDEVRISHFILPIDLKFQDSIQYVEERNDIPVILKYRRQLIQHMKLSHTSIYDVQITNINILEGYKLFVDKTLLIDYPWIKDGMLEHKYKESVQPILIKIDEIETCLEFILFTDVMIFRRYVINLTTLQFNFDEQQNMGSLDFEQEGFSCQIIIRESSEQFKADSINVSFNTLTKLKAMVGKFIIYKFSNNFNLIEFTYKLRYTFDTSLPSYIQAMILRSIPSIGGDYEYTIIVPESKKFPRNHSIDKIILGEKDLYLIRHQETRAEDMETVIETRIKIRKVHILSLDKQQEFKCLTKEGKIIPLDQQYLAYQQIKSSFTIGKFEIMVYRLLKDYVKEYQNKFIATNMRMRLKYNGQKYWITRISDSGLMLDGEFQKCDFYVTNVTDLLTFQLFIHDYLVAETEFCLALARDQFIQEIQRVLYTENDLLYHFHQKIKLKNIWIMGRYHFSPISWTKLFLRFYQMTIDLTDQEQAIRRFSLTITNPFLEKTSKVYSTTSRNIATIYLDDEEIVDQIIHIGEEDKHYFQVQLRQDEDIIGEKLIVLKPFLKRGQSGSPFEFEFKLGEKVTLSTKIEVCQTWKSSLQQKQTTQQAQFDFRKTGYQQMLLKMLNFEVQIADVLPEIFEFIMYSFPDKYDPNILFPIFRALFCVFNDKLTIVAFSVQCMAQISLSHKDAVSDQLEIPILLQQMQDLVLVKNKQFDKIVNEQYYDSNLPSALNNVKSFDYTYNQLVAYLKINSYKVQVDMFNENRDRLSSKIILSCIKIFDNMIQNDIKCGLQLIEKLPIIIEAYHQYDDYNDKIGVTFTIFINTLLNIYNSVDLSNYLNETQAKNIEISSFQSLLEILFQTIEKASHQEFISILVTMHNLIKIVNTSQLPFLKLLLKTLVRSIISQKDLEAHIGIAVEYFQASYQSIVKEVLQQFRLEEIGLKIAKHEFENQQSSNVLTNMFDIILQSIELGVEYPYNELQAFLKKEQPKHDSNKIKIEKFLLYLDKRQERAQRLQMLQQKQIKTQSVDEQKKQVMERFMISKLPW